MTVTQSHKQAEKHENEIIPPSGQNITLTLWETREKLLRWFRKVTADELFFFRSYSWILHEDTTVKHQAVSRAVCHSVFSSLATRMWVYNIVNTCSRWWNASPLMACWWDYICRQANYLFLYHLCTFSTLLSCASLIKNLVFLGYFSGESNFTQSNLNGREANAECVRCLRNCILTTTGKVWTKIDKYSNDWK